MSEPFLAEIRAFSFNFAPQGWAMCNGQLLAISQNQALFALLGTTFGGNGVNNFSLPNLQGTVGLGFGTSQNGTPYALGQIGGEAGHTLTLNETPGPHTHTVNAVVTAPGAGTSVPDPTVRLASAYTNQTGNPGANIYSTSAPTIAMASTSTAGGSQPHSNLMPYLTLTYCIALQGIFPSRS